MGASGTGILSSPFLTARKPESTSTYSLTNRVVEARVRRENDEWASNTLQADVSSTYARSPRAGIRPTAELLSRDEHGKLGRYAPEYGAIWLGSPRAAHNLVPIEHFLIQFFAYQALWALHQLSLGRCQGFPDFFKFFVQVRDHTDANQRIGGSVEKLVLLWQLGSVLTVFQLRPAPDLIGFQYRSGLMSVQPTSGPIRARTF
ncbi:hypothetical protein F6X56_13810 [Rhodococcus erythropolis]|uniref:hypothetical protein n=1 Tax=Rhodococcus erythropolis TaxID=1833 RepID=UPI001248BC35|nr:hypothetical protein [Rhodococcus erythropolis]QEX10714.1 hypothetical protein F6X56_13810 [Rhodococcus erythropolis]